MQKVHYYLLHKAYLGFSGMLRFAQVTSFRHYQVLGSI